MVRTLKLSIKILWYVIYVFVVNSIDYNDAEYFGSFNDY